MYQKTALKGGISLLIDAVSRSIYRPLLRELILLLVGREIVMNITFWRPYREPAIASRVDMVYPGYSCSFSLMPCPVLLVFFLVVINVLDLSGGLW